MEGKEKAKILLIDDEPKELQSISEDLEEDNYDVVGVRTIDEMETKLKENNFDIVIIDYVLTDKISEEEENNGFIAIEKIRKFDKFIPCILFSAFPDHYMKKLTELISKDITFIIKKGEDPQALSVLIERILYKRDEIIKDLQERIIDNPHADDPILMDSEGKKYSLKEMLTEMKARTPRGRELYEIYRRGVESVLKKIESD